MSAERASDAPRVAAFDACLPQTQCGRCGYAGCLPYAEALARGEALPTLCPPGGEATRRALAELLGADAPTPPLPDEPPVVARVREIDCIGCRRCIEVCPVDAILGAAGRMHTVFTAWCNGCALCLPVCPTDCLELAPVAAPPTAAQNRARHARRMARLGAGPRAPRGVELVPLETDGASLKDAVRAAVARRRGEAP